MRAFIQSTSGRTAGKKNWLEPNTAVSIGQGGRATWVIADDPELSLVHFDVFWDGEKLTVEGAGKRLFLLDNAEIEPSKRVEARNGSILGAGRSTFVLRIIPPNLLASLPPPPPNVRPRTEALTAARNEALAALNKEEKLFAILDGARDRRVRVLLNVCQEQSQSLYDGLKGDTLADVAPYLVQLEKDSELLKFLVNETWGESWGIFLIGARPFVEVRRRLRRSLMVRDEESEKKLYFRFYDPRVMRIFWPAATVRQKSEMTGSEISAFLLEGMQDELIRAVPGSDQD